MDDELEKALSKLLSGLTALAASFTKTDQSVTLMTVGLNQMSEFMGKITSQIGSLVGAYNPAAVQSFTLAVQDSTAALGSVLQPALDRFRLVVRGLGDLVASLTPNAKAMIAGLAAAGIGMATMTALTYGLAAAFATATGGLSAVIGAVVGGAVGLAFVTKSFGDVQKLVTQVMGSLSTVMNALGNVAVMLARVFGPILTQFADFATLMADVFGRALDQLTPAIETLAKAMQAYYTILFDAIGKAVVALLPMFINITDTLLKLAGVVFQILAPLVEIVAIFFQLGSVTLNLLSSAANAVVTVMIELGKVLIGPLYDAFMGAGGALNELSAAFNALGRLAGELFVALGQIVAAFLPLLNVLGPLIGGPIITGLKILTSVLLSMANAINFVVREVRLLLGLTGNANTHDPGASTGLGVRNVGTTNPEGYISKIQQSAFGIGNDANAKTAENTKSMAGTLMEMNGYLKSIDGKIKEGASFVGGVATGGIGGIYAARQFLNSVTGK